MAYNGHKNWDYWNVSLWIANDEPLYRTALACLRDCGTATRAAERMLRYHLDKQTPDGAVYTKANVTAALKGLA